MREKLKCMLLSNLGFKLASSLLRVFETEPQIERPHQTKAPMKPIAHIRTDLPQKFGIPRNSFLAPHLQGRIIFEPEYALESAVAGIESFTHLWLIWQFENGVTGGTADDIAQDAATPHKQGTNDKWSPTVRPPRLGGVERVGVFATRSPFRPNSLGLSCVKLERVEITDEGPVLHVLGADLTVRRSWTSNPTFRSPTAIPTLKADGSTEHRGTSLKWIFPNDFTNRSIRTNYLAFWKC